MITADREVLEYNDEEFGRHEMDVIDSQQVIDGVLLSRKRLKMLDDYASLDARFMAQTAYEELKILHNMLPVELKERSWVFQSMTRGWYSR